MKYVKPVHLANGVFIKPYNDERIIRRIRQTLMQEGFDERYLHQYSDVWMIKRNSLLVYYEDSRSSPNYWVKIYRAGKIIGRNDGGTLVRDKQDVVEDGSDRDNRISIENPGGIVLSLHLVRDIEHVTPVRFQPQIITPENIVIQSQCLVNGFTLVADIIFSPSQKEKILSSVDSLENERGLLFVFNIEGSHPFSKKGFKFPSADVVWLNYERKAVHIEQNVSLLSSGDNQESRTSKATASEGGREPKGSNSGIVNLPSNIKSIGYVVLKEGFVSRHEVKVGTLFDFQPPSPYAIRGTT